MLRSDKRDVPVNRLGQVVSDGLCMGCGACVGVCPVKGGLGLTIVRGIPQPRRNGSCRNCGRCYAICPGDKIDFSRLGEAVFGCPWHPSPTGPVLRVFTGHAADTELRTGASSGGVVSSLLCYALEANLIDKAIVAQWKDDDPTRAAPMIAGTRQEILAARGSKYTPVPMGESLSWILENEGRYGVVGLPCQIAAFRQAALMFQEVRERVVLCVGLFCDTMLSENALDFWFGGMGVDRKKVNQFSFRGEGWPGKMSIKTDEGSYSFGLADYWNSLHRLSPTRCTVCPDGLGELADISLGDAWLPEYETERLGKSMICVRSETGRRFWDAAVQAGVILAEETTVEKLKESQRVVLRNKKVLIQDRIRARTVLRKSVPVFRGAACCEERGSLVRGLMFYLGRGLGELRVFWPISWGIRWWKKTYRGSLIYRIFHLSGGGIEANADIERWVNEGQPRVLIVNQADLLNKGDQALLWGTVQLVKTAFPEASIRVVTHTPKIDADRCPWPVLPTFRIRERGRRDRIVIRSGLWLLGLFQKTGLGKRLIRRLPPTLRAYWACDLVISRGGDNWTQDYGYPGLYFDAVDPAFYFRKPTVLLGETVGPFSTPEVQKEAVGLLKRFDTLVVRDRLSYEYLNALGLSPGQLRLLPDVAFSLEPATADELSRMMAAEGISDDRESRIVFSVSSLISQYGFNDGSSETRSAEYQQAMSDVADHCIERYGIEVVFIGHVIGENNDDRAAAREVVGRMRNGDRARVIQGEYSHQVYRAFLGKMAVMAVMSRMHGAVGAVTMGVPVVPIGYSRKTQGIFGQMLGLGDLIVDIRTCGTGIEFTRCLTDRVDDCWARRKEIQEKLLRLFSDLRGQMPEYAALLQRAVSKEGSMIG